MSVQRYNITNISNQVIPILYGKITAANSVTAVPANDAGQLNIPPKSSLVIESLRVDVGQLDAFRQKNLITYTTQ